jgi:hypothetical protein
VTEWYPEARAYSRDERLKQLGEFTHLCRTIARSLRRHGKPWAADGFDDRADAAEALSHDGWDQPALTEVGANFPSGVDWQSTSTARASPGKRTLPRFTPAPLSSL